MLSRNDLNSLNNEFNIIWLYLFPSGGKENLHFYFGGCWEGRLRTSISEENIFRGKSLLKTGEWRSFVSSCCIVPWKADDSCDGTESCWTYLIKGTLSMRTTVWQVMKLSLGHVCLTPDETRLCYCGPEEDLLRAWDVCASYLLKCGRAHFN